MHILDIVQNSIDAGSTLIDVYIEENTKQNIFKFIVKDNGRGMDPDFMKNIFDPFVTTRKTRRVGLGLPLLKEATQRCGGDVRIFSQLGKGTKVEAYFKRDNIDLPPMGDLAGTIVTIISSASGKNIDIEYVHKFNDNDFTLDTRILKKTLGEVPLNDISVLKWIREYVAEGLNHLCGGGDS